MKKILLATTMLVGTAGFAAAEMAVTGSAVMGVGDNGGPNGARAIMETYVTFTGSGETDGGLSFGLSSTMATYSVSDEAFTDDGTTVFISGAFGKLTFGDVDEADEVATLKDIGGVVGLGVDNVAELLSGDSSGRPSHDVNYSYSTGALSLGISTRLGNDGSGDAYAVGAKYDFSNAYVGLGYNVDNETADAGSVVSAFAGGTFGAVGVKAMYSTFSPDAAGADDISAWGLYADYTTGALTLMAEYADNDLVTDAAFGIGASYDLGGGAAVVGGVADNGTDTVWEAGLSMNF